MRKFLVVVLLEAISVAAGTVTVLLMWNLLVVKAFAPHFVGITAVQALVIDLGLGLCHAMPIPTRELREMSFNELMLTSFSSTMSRFVLYIPTVILIYLVFLANK